jgi:hypothetical protein
MHRTFIEFIDGLRHGGFSCWLEKKHGGQGLRFQFKPEVFNPPPTLAKRSAKN